MKLGDDAFMLEKKNLLGVSHDGEHVRTWSSVKKFVKHGKQAAISCFGSRIHVHESQRKGKQHLY